MKEPSDKPVLRTLDLFDVELVSGVVKMPMEGADVSHLMLALSAEQEANLNGLTYEVAEAFDLGGTDWQGPRVKEFKGYTYVLSARLSNHGTPCQDNATGALVAIRDHAFAGRRANVRLCLFAYAHRGHQGVGVALEGLILAGLPTALQGLQL
jgi:hypothetical protein